MFGVGASPVMLLVWAIGDDRGLHRLRLQGGRPILDKTHPAPDFPSEDEALHAGAGPSFLPVPATCMDTRETAVNQSTDPNLIFRVIKTLCTA